MGRTQSRGGGARGSTLSWTHSSAMSGQLTSETVSVVLSLSVSDSYIPIHHIIQ